jgi:3-isopropylmalate dehydrogenase
VANPLATILSAAMMLRYTFNQEAAAQRVERRCEGARPGFRTGDIAEPGTKTVGTRRWATRCWPRCKLLRTCHTNVLLR